ncbi:MAG TPA: ribonuclease T2 [Afifellaceae bacterium]|nr:ribonuclease T2 [Afifellaceae bacterium]
MRGGLAALLIWFLALLPGGGANGQDRPGAFDFYVLSLSWSPSFCRTEAAEGERPQCASGRRDGFIVHGLWPQYESGWPEFCPSDAPAEPPRSLVERLLDIIPSPGLVAHQWRKHGACSGLDQASYFALLRQAREQVVVPEALRIPDRRRTASAREVEQAFVAANPGLSATGIAVSCRDGRLNEVRICLTRRLDFRRCHEVDRRGCTDRRLAIPAHGR